MTQEIPFNSAAPMRVVCLVPSISETLIACGVNLVGRTRFCIHPQQVVDQIEKVGGTKDIDWAKVAPLKPDLVIFDREENTLEMAKTCPFASIVLHIQRIEDVAVEFQRLAQRIGNLALVQIALRWQQLCQKSFSPMSLDKMPGVIEWWRKPQGHEKILYLIWRDPWMAAGENIFIQSIFDRIGYNERRHVFDEKYPSIALDAYSPDDTLLLCSSEPYPFARRRKEMKALGFPCALIDGEKYSWYGLRSLEFLESITTHV